MMGGIQKRIAQRALIRRAILTTNVKAYANGYSYSITHRDSPKLFRLGLSKQSPGRPAKQAKRLRKSDCLATLQEPELPSLRESLAKTPADALFSPVPPPAGNLDCRRLNSQMAGSLRQAPPGRR